MISMTQTLTEIYEALNAISGLKVFHYAKPEKTKAPYLVWTETGEGDSFYADMKKAELVLQGDCDYFTQTEFDENIDAINDALNGIANLRWQILSVQYEDDTKLIHYQWQWEIANHGDRESNN